MPIQIPWVLGVRNFFKERREKNEHKKNEDLFVQFNDDAPRYLQIINKGHDARTYKEKLVFQRLLNFSEIIFPSESNSIIYDENNLANSKHPVNNPDFINKFADAILNWDDENHGEALNVYEKIQLLLNPDWIHEKISSEMIWAHGKAKMVFLQGYEQIKGEIAKLEVKKDLEQDPSEKDKIQAEIDALKKQWDEQLDLYNAFEDSEKSNEKIWRDSLEAQKIRRQMALEGDKKKYDKLRRKLLITQVAGENDVEAIDRHKSLYQATADIDFWQDEPWTLSKFLENVAPQNNQKKYSFWIWAWVWALASYWALGLSLPLIWVMAWYWVAGLAAYQLWKYKKEVFENAVWWPIATVARSAFNIAKVAWVAWAFLLNIPLKLVNTHIPLPTIDKDWTYWGNRNK